MTLFSSQACDKDTFLYLGEATTNYGTNVQLQVGAQADDTAVRSLLSWNLGFQQPFYLSTISSAILSLWVYGDSKTAGDTFRVYWVTTSWIEAQATWNVAYTGTNWDTPGGDWNTNPAYGPIASTVVSNSETVGTEIQFNLDPEIIKYIINIQYTPGTGGGNDCWLDFIVKADTENGGGYYAFDSAEGTTAGERPKLVINYTQALMGQVI